MTIKDVNGLQNKYGIEDAEKACDFVSELLNLKARKIEKEEPYAVNTIKKLDDAAYEAWTLTTELWELEGLIMKFDWTNFTEVDFANYCAKAENVIMASDDYVGCVRVGDLCFDLVARMDDNCEKWCLLYDLYVGGVDTGYGYSNRNKDLSDYPYDYAGGGDFEDGLIWMTYEEFQKHAEEEFVKFITTWPYQEASLVDKANQPLNIW